MDPGNVAASNPPLTNDYRNFIARFSGATSTADSATSKIWVCGQDVVRSVEANTDYRLIAARTNVPASFFSPIQPQYSDGSTRQVHSFNEADNGGGEYPFVGSYLGKFVPGANYGQTSPIPKTGYDFSYSTNVMFNQFPTNMNLQPVAGPPGSPAANDSPLGGYDPAAFGSDGVNTVAANGVYAGTNITGPGLSYPPGDWDTGFGEVPDGSYINKADEGTIYTTTFKAPYFNNVATYVNAGSTFFSPSRQMPSAAMFGSLSTGVNANRPWQTLLFRPDPGGTPQHLGAQSPQDHLLLDLFNMPVVEPYAISDPFSTAGKVNMNYQIVPFTYINRSTAVQAVLKSEQILALANTDANTYKVQSASMANRRNFLDLTQTLTGFQNMFATGTTDGTGTTPDIFRAASQICNIWLVPQGQTYAGMPNYWNNYLLTGDNVRERPYANLYPRLTTKSNTFTVHYRVQMLKKVPATAANQWVEGTDVVSSEYRGSSTLERYLDTSANCK